MTLPIHDILPEVLRELRNGPRAVLVAPPGAGKTTAVAPALLKEPWCSGQILLLSPRRLAARAAAERIADLLGEKLGGVVGYATRMDTRQSVATRILVLTEGIFRRRILDDPELSGVSAVLFDEVHERSLDSDFGLALALDVQAAFRPDLRIVPMSATLDGARFAELLDGAPVLESEGRSHPLELRYLGRNAEQRIEQGMAAAIRQALRDEADGDVLAFLPGVAEIERTAEALIGLDGVAIHKLHGSLDPAEQRRALRPNDSGQRKVILATSIAETSLTIDGVRIVVDSGLARRPRYDRAAGVTRLMTEKASQAAATQRAGRAARQRPGVAYRLWEQAATAGMPPYDPPEILESELSGLLLECALWGVSDPRTMRWLDGPPDAAIAEARGRLQSMGALAVDNAITDHGRAIARLPLEPRVAHMLIAATQRGIGGVASEVAVLLGERGLGGNDVDLSHRLDRFRSERGARADTARRLASRWARLVNAEPDEGSSSDVATCVALAFPDRLAKRRGADGTDWASVGGRGFRLDPTHPLARAEWLAVAEVQGSSAGARILSAAPLDEADVRTLFADRIEVRREAVFRPDSLGVEALRQTRLGAVVLTTGSDDAPDVEAVATALLDGIGIAGVDRLPWSDKARRLRQRASFAGIDTASDEAVLAALGEGRDQYLGGKRKIADISTDSLSNLLDMLMGWDERKRLDALAPDQFETPAGTLHAIDYLAEGGPTVELRVQALYGLASHPTVGTQSIPLRLSLTSPAGRPIQTTIDLPGFWAGTWKDVAKEMRGRYPKHNWPDDPTSATASLKTKRAQNRE